MNILNTIGLCYSQEAKNILETVGHVDYANIKNQGQLEKMIAGYSAAVIGLGLRFDRKVIDAGKKLKIIATATTGTDHIDVEYARKKGIKVLCLKNDRKFLDRITGTAELAFLLLLVLMRNFLPANRSAMDYCWTEKFRGHNLNEKTLGIVGLGRLGSMVARFGKAFGMEVLAFDPYINPAVFKSIGCKKVTFQKLLKSSDVISIHVHLNRETEGMFGKEVFEKMKSSAMLINTSRGKIVNEKELLDAIRKKKIAGYGADVLANELDFNAKFEKNVLIEYARRNSNVIITPHVGGVTFESRKATDIFIAKKLKRIIEKWKKN